MQEQRLRRSKGGFSTKLHSACDALNNTVKKALDLVKGREIEALIGDKGYVMQTYG